MNKRFQKHFETGYVSGGGCVPSISTSSQVCPSSLFDSLFVTSVCWSQLRMWLAPVWVGRLATHVVLSWNILLG